MTKFNYVSLFSGIGGFEQALNKLGGTCVLASEIDKFASQSYAALYGAEHLHGDITQIDAKDVPDHDILVGGFPCQSFSVAGKRGGFEDARGTLFFEMARIAKEKQPKVFLAENVKGLVSHDKGRTLDTIVKTLNDIGYRVDFDVLNSKYFGVPQNRERIFIVAIREDLVDNEPWVIEGTTVVPKGKRRISGYDDVKTINFDFPEHGEVTTRLRDVLEAKVDEKYYLGEEKTANLVAQLNEGSRLGEDGKLGTLVNGSNISPNIDANYAKGLGPADVAKNRNRRPMITEEGLPIREATRKGYTTAAVGDAVNIQFPNSQTRRGRVGKGIANTIEASGVNQGVVEPKLAVTKNYGEFKPRKDDVSTAIDANYASFPDNHGQRTGVAESGLTHKYRIRRLTPLETWRLQGFSDEAHQTVVDAGISDSQRYKQAGNAVTVNVIEAIGERLLPYL